MNGFIISEDSAVIFFMFGDIITTYIKFLWDFMYTISLCLLSYSVNKKVKIFGLLYKKWEFSVCIFVADYIYPSIT